MSDTGAQQCPLDNDIESRLSIVCSFVCTCNEVPNKGSGGINLKQSCVDVGIQRLNETCDTGLRVQVPYYMGSAPPSPLLLKDAEGLETIEPIRNFGHSINRIVRMKRDGALLTETAKNREEGYTRGELRIPDAVALRDPNGRPTQDNLLGVIEVKFPPDDWGPGQEVAYRDIAGGRDKLKLLTPERCSCDGPRQTEYETDTQPAMEIYHDRLEEKGISWGQVAIGAGMVAAGAAVTYFSAGTGSLAGGQAVRQGASMIAAGMGLGTAAAW
ncbi:hypothetical protein [Billgrantia kenyensis]|uniref:VRR-NUC domain-containing protein n=1 Tax=Billgrantia kenyensis TaxID=321266 RepID=A0A7V9W2A1_9GAMM|nr:hypothetical protein [Halomonas kenyensis]MBA2779748.1 hypothetical protein [Halomonas kenyensis]MCG6662564.1 hypothetical protein [Halomonas kenyensis]